MTIDNGYVTLEEAKPYLSIGDTDDDTALALAIEAASRVIDDWCGRRFYNATETRYYTPWGANVLDVDDLVSVTTLKTDHDGDGTYETTWSASDFRLGPYNASLNGRPYRQVERTPAGSYSFPNVDRGVEIAGSFGWPSVPDAVKQACVIQTNIIFKLATEGAAPIVTMSGATLPSSKYLDSGAQMLLRPYRRLVVR